MAARAPLFCIVPPHILMEIAGKGAPRERAWALRALTLSERVRGRREVIGSMPGGAPAGMKRRSIFDAEGTMTLPGRLVRTEDGPPSEDHSVNEAFAGAGETYDLYEQAFGRSSIDGRGMRLDATVHFGSRYDNAFWDGRQMVYGDGDGRYFGRFTACMEVIGHELSHGVIQHEANLEYQGEPGALNESFADIFGSLVRQRALRQTARRADWLVGRGLFTDRVRGDALRSLKAPGTAYDDPVLGRDPQPAHMDAYKDADFDNGGVHINSGIPNHAFYKAAVAMGGYAWERAGRIWYLALRDRLRRGSGFARAAAVTLAIARELFGAKSPEARAVIRGWDAVGVDVGAGERATRASYARAALAGS